MIKSRLHEILTPATGTHCEHCGELTPILIERAQMYCAGCWEIVPMWALLFDCAPATSFGQFILRDAEPETHG